MEKKHKTRQLKKISLILLLLCLLTGCGDNSEKSLIGVPHKSLDGVYSLTLKSDILADYTENGVEFGSIYNRKDGKIKLLVNMTDKTTMNFEIIPEGLKSESGGLILYNPEAFKDAQE